MKKKIFRILALALTAVIMTVSLSGCDALDTLRENHAFWTDDGAIMLGEDKYLPIEYSEHLFPLFDEVNDTEIMVTEKDVPVLAATFVGESFTLNSDASFMKYYAWDSDIPVYYCREDLYESITDRIENGYEADGFCYRYTSLDDDGFYMTCDYKLSEAEAGALRHVIYNVVPTELPKIASTIDSQYSVSMYVCSKDTLFRTYAGEVGVSTDGVYYLSEYDGETTYVYYVPEDKEALFSSMLATYIDNYIDNYIPY